MKKNNLPLRLFVVIHAQHTENDTGLTHTISEAQKAFDSGVDGIFLIPDYENERNGYSIRAQTEDLFLYYTEIKKRLPDFLVGVNFLKRFKSLNQSLIDKIVDMNFDMIQSDGSYQNMFLSIGTSTEFFTGLAFKYSRQENASGDVLKNLCDQIPKEGNIIPTTSGSATGKAANLKKIEEIRSFLGRDQRLGIASGITYENIESFKERGVTDFLVATSLIQDNLNGFDILSEEKIKLLVEKIK